MKFPNHRENLGCWLNDQSLLGSFVEVGCAFGGFASSVLASWRGKIYYMIDPWAVQDPMVYRERQEEEWKYNEWFNECSAIAERDKRVVIMRNLSVDGSELIDDQSLDGCYIDGNHSFKAVSEDLRAWWPKVKSGGLFSGHDFGNQTMDQVAGWDCEVQRALELFVAEMDLQMPVVTPCSSWWMMKP